MENGRATLVDESALRARAQQTAERTRTANSSAWELAGRISPHLAAACRAAAVEPYPVNRYAVPT